MSTKFELFTREENPFGKSWEQWTIEWWQWLFSIPKQNNPALDETGENFELNFNNNDNNVIFLAGSDVNRGKIFRTISIPIDKAILFPVINFITSYLENPFLKTEKDLIFSAKSNIDDILLREVELDGIQIQISEKHRIRSPIFNLFLPENNLYDIEPGYTKAISDGYWIFLKNLSHESHTIHTRGSCLAGKIKIDVTFSINIIEETTAL